MRINLGIERLTTATRIDIKKNVLTITYDFTPGKVDPKKGKLKASDPKKAKLKASKLRGWHAYKAKKNDFIPGLMREYWNKTDGFLDYSGIFDAVELKAVYEDGGN